MKNQIILFVGILLLLGLFIVPNKIREYRASSAASSKKATNTTSVKSNKNKLVNVPGGSAQNVDLRLDESNWRGLLGKSTANVKIYNKGIYNEAYDHIRIHIISYDRYGHKLGERIENLREQLCKGESVKKTLEISRNTDEIYCTIAHAQPAPCRKNLRGRETAEARSGGDDHGHGHGGVSKKEKRRSKKEAEQVFVDERTKAQREADYIRKKEAEARRIADEQAELDRLKRRSEEELQARIRQEEDRAAKRIAKERRRTESRLDRMFRPKDSKYDTRYNERYADVNVKEPRVKKEGRGFGNFFKRSHGYYHGKNGGQQCPYCSEQIGYKDSFLDPVK